MKFKTFVFSIVTALLFCASAFAGSITITWSAATDPAAGWNLYLNHLQTPDALQYTGSYSPSERSATFHNISETGLYQVGVSRVETVNDNGTTRRIEGPVEVLTFLDGQLLTTPSGVTVTSASFDVNGS